MPPDRATDGTVAAFFDVDNTILRGASIFHLGVGLYRRKFLSLRDISHIMRINLRYALFGESAAGIEATRTKSLDAIKGRPSAQMAAVAEQVWDEVLSGRVYPGTRELLDRHVAQGHEVWLISASPTEVVSLIADRVGATGGLGTIAEREHGLYTGRLVGGLLHGPQKAVAVQRLAEQRSLDLTRCFAYGDSGNDIPMLQLVGNPCGINPDKRLRRYCAAHAWPVREFRAKRRAVRRSIRTAYRVGGFWAVWVVIQRLFGRPGRHSKL
ncbi:MAG: HAD-IB family hydrolase [Bifidobacteriaceae bacterium]|jgi:HAD superfamily hydrolase (TIGR01490 family)|nr:HAD-IB family hydrolase [Bifidobacteriaceae bacterium]